MRLRNRFRKSKKKEDGDLGLQITSLADILMIVLIFLLKSFSSGLTDGNAIQVSNKIALPSVQGGGIGREGLKVEITEDKVEMSGHAVAALSAYRFNAGDLNGDLESSSTSKALNQAFAAERRAVDQTPKNTIQPVAAIADGTPTVVDIKSFSKDTIWIVADRKAPYATIQTVIASAAMQGYSDFKLAVVQGE